MPIENNEVVSVLNNLIETCEDGAQGFKSSAEAVKNPSAKALFASRLPRIEQGKSELQAEVRRLGGKPEEGGSISGSVHRGWINLKSAITGKNDDAIIAETVRGEEHAAQQYEDALQKDLPIETRVIVDRQYRGVVENLEKCRALSSTESTPYASHTGTDASDLASQDMDSTPSSRTSM